MLDNILDRVRENETGKVKMTKNIIPWKTLVPLAACLAIVLAATLPRLLKSPAAEPGVTAPVNTDSITGAGNQATAPSQTDYEYHEKLPELNDIRGLPAGDYTWTEWGEDDGMHIESDRLATNELRFLMRELDRTDPAASAAFAVVRVGSVERFEKDRLYGSESQVSEVQEVYGVLGDDLNNTVMIKQYLYGGCTNDEETNLLREGGVYVLSLAKYEPDKYWYIYGDLDCLFEIDDKGLIHSHSVYEQLNKYDGKPLADLWSDIEYLYANPILRSNLAEHFGYYGMDVEFVGDTVRLYYPPHGWNPADTFGFSANFNADGKLSVADRLNEGRYNIFSIFEGFTKDEIIAALGEIRQFLGIADSDPSAPTPTPMDASAEDGGYSASPGYGGTSVSIPTPEDAHTLLLEQYRGTGEVRAEFQAVTTLGEKTDAYLFIVTLPDGTEEYAAISISNGKLFRLEALEDGGFAPLYADD
jgi:hypothetical protein